MKADIEWTQRSLSIALVPDDSDAIPLVPEIWFRFDRTISIDKHRAGLLAYLLCSDLVGNCFNLTGTSLPPHLAALIQNCFLGHELMIGGIDNVPINIARTPKYGTLICDVLGTQALDEVKSGAGVDCLMARRTKLGFEVLDEQQTKLLDLSTNLPLHAAASALDPCLIMEAAVFLLIFDTLAPRAIKLSNGDSEHARVISQWIRDAGGEVA